MQNAIKAITASPSKKISIREACKIYNVKFATLVRNLRSFQASGKNEFEYKVKYDVKKVYTPKKRIKLVQYITSVSKMYYGMTKKRARVLAFKFAIANKN